MEYREAIRNNREEIKACQKEAQFQLEQAIYLQNPTLKDRSMTFRKQTEIPLISPAG